MTTNQWILALDQGTTSSRAIVFDKSGRALASAQQEFPQITPSAAHVEHDPEAIWTSQSEVAREALQRAGISAADVAAIGVANQRETTVLWERDTGKPVHNAIVWQSRISAPICERMKQDGLESLVRERTGLLIDAYFSATKIAYLLELYPDLRARAERGEILFGTIDTYLIWRLTGGQRHVTDVSNASRTMLFDIHRLDWCPDLLATLDIPRAILPTVLPSSGVLGTTRADWLGAEIPIAGVAGDQQAALFGQTCFATGSSKNTYGTGCFLLMNTGSQPVTSRHRLLTTIAWKIDDELVYCLEGAAFMGGAVVQWLRDGLHVIQRSADVERLAAQAEDNGGVVFVPAFVGMGAPYWDPDARGMIIGLSRHTTVAHLARAAVESMAFQTRDLLESMRQDVREPVSELRVDGGASVNNDLMQFQADLLGVPTVRPMVAETTALGVAYLAGLAVGYWTDQNDVAGHWALDRRFEPQWTGQQRDAAYARWQRAVQRALQWETPS